MLRPEGPAAQLSPKKQAFSLAALRGTIRASETGPASMAFELNLRADLAKLSDEDLAARFDQASRAYDEAARAGKWSWRPIILSRGPIRHPRAYRFLSLLESIGDAHPLAWLIAAIFSSRRYEAFLNKTNPNAMYLQAYEMQDIVDEIGRRIQYRKASAA
jgi:hypothetical protein